MSDTAISDPFPWEDPKNKDLFDTDEDILAVNDEPDDGGGDDGPPDDFDDSPELFDDDGDPIEVTPIPKSPTAALDYFITVANQREYFDSKELAEMISAIDDEGNNVAEITDRLLERQVERTYIDGPRVMNALLDIRNIKYPYPGETVEDEDDADE